MNSLLLVFLLLQAVVLSSSSNYNSNVEFPEELEVLEDTAVEYCFKTVARSVEQSDDDEDDDDDDDDEPAERQITRICCEGWYTPEGKPLCSAKNLTYIEHKKATTGYDKSEEDDPDKSVPSTRASTWYRLVRYFKAKIASLEESSKKQEERIKYLEEQMANLSRVEEFKPTTVERAALSTDLSTADPCSTATCPDHPEADCMVTSRCGRDIAVFVDDELKTVNCNNNEPCDLLPPTFCPDDPCLGLQCDGYPDAICIVTECDCKPSFMLPDGSTPSCDNMNSPHITTSNILPVIS